MDDGPRAGGLSSQFTPMSHLVSGLITGISTGSRGQLLMQRQRPGRSIRRQPRSKHACVGAVRVSVTVTVTAPGNGVMRLVTGTSERDGYSTTPAVVPPSDATAMNLRVGRNGRRDPVAVAPPGPGPLVILFTATIYASGGVTVHGCSHTEAEPGENGSGHSDRAGHSWPSCARTGLGRRRAVVDRTAALGSERKWPHAHAPPKSDRAVRIHRRL